MIVDAHHHLWDPARREYPWLPANGVLDRAFGLADLRAVMGPAGVTRTVLVQTVADTAETREFLEVAAASDGLVAGVVGWVDLTAPDVGAQLDAVTSGPGGAHLVGVRHQAHDEPDAGWLARPEVLRGLAEVARRDLAYDLLVRARELPAARTAARAVPQLRFVIDHAAKPEIAVGVDEPWRSRLASLAACDNVVCKVSGLVTEADPARWTVADLRSYVDAVVEMFGPGRLMFGSDWPVCLLAADYPTVLDAARRCLAALSPDERAEVFAGTAVRTYGLPAST